MSLDKFLRPKETDMARTVKERCAKLVAALEERGDEDALFTVQEARMEEAFRLKEKYPELCEQIEAYHALTGSGQPIGMETIPDFVGEDSVTKFLEKLEEELAKKTV